MQKLPKRRSNRIGIACYPWIGGSGILGTNLAMSLQSHGHRVSLISIFPPYRLRKDSVRFYQAPIIPHPSFQPYVYQSSVTETLVRVALADELEVIHAHYLFPFGAAAIEAKDVLAQKKYPIKVVLTPHGTDTISIAEHHAPNLTAYLLRRSDAVTTASVDLKSRVDALLGQKKAVVIPNFVDFFQVKSVRPIPKRTFAPRGEKLIMHISNFRPIKRLDDTLTVFHSIRKKISAKLVLIGDVDMLSKQRIMRRIAKDRDVILVGRRRCVYRYLKVADALLTTSSYENCSMTILEAMACGVPILGTRVGGNPELVEHGHTGYLAPLGQHDRLAAYGVQLLSDEKLQRAMGLNAKIASEEYSSVYIIPQYELLYRFIIRGQRVAPAEFSVPFATS